MAELLRPLPDWEDHEKPALPGTASYPWHPPQRRLAYALVAILIAITGGLGNALLSANLPQIQGQLGLSPAEGAWLTAAWMMTNASANLLLFKARQQFGLRLFTEVSLGIYALLALLHLFVGSFTTTVLVRLASGFAGGACTALGTIYMLQALPRQYVGRTLTIGAGLAQLALPLAWVVSPLLMSQGDWHQLYQFEAGLALCAFAAVVVLKLPPGIQQRVFAPADLLTFALLAPALGLLVVVLSQGQVRWWLDTPWLGMALMASLLLFTTAVLIEHHRTEPLLQIRWLLTAPMLRFFAGAFLLRFLTNEQSFGMVGLMRTVGMGPEQMAPLFAVILLGVAVGIATSALTFGPKALIPQLGVSIALFAIAALLDQHRSSADRPMDFALSQFLAAAGSGMYMGPLMLMGFRLTLARGLDHVVSFIVLFSLTQTFGALAGNAVLGTWQQHREHVHLRQLVDQVQRSDPLLAQRLAGYTASLQPMINDPVQRQAQATAQLAQSIRRQAQVRAYNDVFALSGWLAVGFLGWLLARITLRDPRLRRFFHDRLHGHDTGSVP